MATISCGNIRRVTPFSSAETLGWKMSIRLASCCHMQFTMPNTSTICVMEVYVPTTALQIFIRWNPLRLINSAVKRGYEIRQGVTTLPSPPPSCFFVATTDNGAAAAAVSCCQAARVVHFSNKHNFQTGQKWLDSPRLAEARARVVKFHYVDKITFWKNYPL